MLSQGKVVEKIKRATVKDLKWSGDFAILTLENNIQLPLNFFEPRLCVVFQEVFGEYAKLEKTIQLASTANIIPFNALPIWTRLDIARNHKILFKTKKFDEYFWMQTIKEASESRAMKMHVDKKKEEMQKIAN